MMKKIYPWEVNDFSSPGDEVPHHTEWDKVTDFDEEGYGWVSTDSGWGFVNRDGYLVIPDEYDLTFYPHFQNGLCRAIKNGKYGIFDRDNNAVIPFIYDTVFGDFDKSDPVLAASLNGKWGLMDLRQNEILPFVYDYITGFNDHHIAVRLGEYFGVVDYGQNTVMNFKWDYLHLLDGNFSVGKALEIYFDKDKIDSLGSYSSENYKDVGHRYQKIKYGIINRDGKVIYPFISDSPIHVFNPASGRAKISLNHFENPAADVDYLSFVADMEGNRIPFDPPIKEEEWIDTFHKSCHELIWGKGTWPY